MPDNYTNHVSKTQRYKMIGNGWTVDVIAHILNSIKVIEAYDDAYNQWHKMHNETKEQV